MRNATYVGLWEADHACGVTDGLGRSMARAEENLDGGIAVVERAVVTDSTRGGMMHIRTGTRWTGRKAGEDVQWTEGDTAEAELPLKRESA
jgi:hypothetical protein